VHGASASSAAVSRRLAAELLETQLLRLARAGAVIERRLGPGLQTLSARRLHRRLGFVRLGDYLTERLGISLRRCQSIVRLERLLVGLPTVAAAFDAGDLPTSKLAIIAAAATPETQDLWLGRAQRLTVRELERVARETKQTPVGGDAQGADGEDLLPEGSAAVASHAPEDEEPGIMISFAVPGRAFALWHWAIEFVRRVAGRQDPAWRCAEYLAAEFLSGCPDAEGSKDEALQQHDAPSEHGPPGASTDDGSAPADDSYTAHVAARRVPDVAVSDQDVWERAVSAVRDALRPLGAAADVEKVLSTSLPAAFEGGEPDPWALDGHLRGLVRLRQSLAWRMGRLLTAVASLELDRELGYDSLGEWCRIVLGMSPRRARYLVSLDRRLERIPLVADAYRRGLVSWCQARLLVRVARPGTENRWIRYARRVTVRRLEDAITRCAVAAADPAIGGGALTSEEGTPLPPEEPAPDADMTARASTSVPGGAIDVLPLALPRRHTLAPGDGAVPSTAAIDVPRHTLAPEPCTHRIAFWAPLDVADVWRNAIRACRRARGTQLRDWECLLIFILEMRDGWQPNENAEWRRRSHILDRDGWRCLAPGCTSRSHLNVHHLVYRSQNGGEEPGNLVTLCMGHHQAGVHDNLIRCQGRAPEAIFWELGVRANGPPLARYFGDRIVGVRAGAGLGPERL
jgi:hypothetical protein